MAIVWNNPYSQKKVKEMDSYWKHRCVNASKLKKTALVQLAANELDIEVDSEGPVTSQ